MNDSRTIFIGDVHWCYKEFKLLLEKIKLNKKDKVYLVWDLIGKWPKSFKILKFLYTNKEQFKIVKWNYEINFSNWQNGEENIENEKSFNKLNKKLEKHPEIMSFLKELPIFINDENFLLIHWWLIPWKSLEDHSIDELTRTREYKEQPWYNYYKWEKKIIYWHRWIDWLRIRKNTIWLDTWCVYWKHLTAYILETWEIFQQSALDIYINVYKINENK